MRRHHRPVTAARIVLPLLAAAVTLSPGAFATAPRYVVSEADGQRVVHDVATGLAWQQQASHGPLDWDDALRHCVSLTWAGSSDWRLPDVLELSTLVDDAKETPPAINTVYFQDFEPGAGYWTSTTSRQAAASAYVLYFNEQNATVGRGGINVVNKTASMRALCVRDDS